jgi:pyruvate dehydrogenase E1 component alpha subunit
MSDPATYRTKEEVTEYKDNHDPIGGLKEYILKNKFSDTETLKNIERNIKNRIKEVAEFSENSNFPAEAELDKNIYHTI